MNGTSVNLKELVISKKCRKGQADGTTKRGAYWLVLHVQIRTYGGDGVGNASASCKHVLELRHFRSGEVRAVVHYHSWHQNYGTTDLYYDCSQILDCSTVEEVIVSLKGVKIGEDGDVSAYSDRAEEELTSRLTGLGLPASAPAPDEV